MNQLTAYKEEYTRNQADLYLAFGLGTKEWKLGFLVGFLVTILSLTRHPQIQLFAPEGRGMGTK